MTNDENPLSALQDSDRLDMDADPRFAGQLEARLRIQHAEGRPARVPLWRRLGIVAPAMLVLLVVASITVVIRDQSPSSALVLTHASNVVVHLPDGTSIEDPADGFMLGNGAVIEIRDGGEATIDGVTLDTAAFLTVRDGLLVSDVEGANPTDRSDAAAASDPTAPEPDSDGTTTSTTAPPPTTGAPRDPDDAPTTEPADRPRPDDHPTTTVRDHSRTDDEPRQTPLEISLRTQMVDGGVRVSWSVAGGEDGWRTVVVRQAGDSHDDRSLEGGIDALVADPTIAVVADNSGLGAGELVDTPPEDGGQVRYRVVVVDETGGIVDASAPRGLRRH